MPQWSNSSYHKWAREWKQWLGTATRHGAGGTAKRRTARYADTPMDFANACVVRLVELHAGASVCTTDNHFSFFRKKGSEQISVVAPFSR